MRKDNGLIIAQSRNKYNKVGQTSLNEKRSSNKNGSKAANDQQ